MRKGVWHCNIELGSWNVLYCYVLQLCAPSLKSYPVWVHPSQVSLKQKENNVLKIYPAHSSKNKSGKEMAPISTKQLAQKRLRMRHNAAPSQAAVTLRLCLAGNTTHTPRQLIKVEGCVSHNCGLLSFIGM